MEQVSAFDSSFVPVLRGTFLETIGFFLRAYIGGVSWVLVFNILQITNDSASLLWQQLCGGDWQLPKPQKCAGDCQFHASLC